MEIVLKHVAMELGALQNFLFDETNKSEFKIKSDAGILIAKKIDRSKY